MEVDTEAHQGNRYLKYWREGDINEKLNMAPRDIGSILIAAAAAALCVMIDILLKEGSDESV